MYCTQLLAQLEQLSKLLVHTLLKDETTLSTITTFVQQILANPEVNDSVLRIVLRVIHDERTVEQVVALLQRVLAKPDTKDALVSVLANAMQDGLGQEASIEYVRAVVTAEATKELLSQLATAQVRGRPPQRMRAPQWRCTPGESRRLDRTVAVQHDGCMHLMTFIHLVPRHVMPCLVMFMVGWYGA